MGAAGVFVNMVRQFDICHVHHLVHVRSCFLYVFYLVYAFCFIAREAGAPTNCHLQGAVAMATSLVRYVKSVGN